MTSETLLTVVELSDAVMIPCAVVRRLVVLGVVEPAQREPELLFTPEAAFALRRMSRLRRDLGINYHGGRVVLDLMDRISQLERELAIRVSGNIIDN